MTIRPTPYYLTSLLIALSSCVLFVLSAFQLYGDDDYVYNYLGCGPNGDSVAIPIMGSIVVSIFWAAAHVIAHVFFINTTRTKAVNKNFKINLGFNKDEKMAAYITKSIFHLFVIFLVYDYAVTFYKFYLFQFASFIATTITVLIYGQTISNFIGTKNKQIETKVTEI